MPKELLSPLQLVELGSRITEKRAEELRIVALIDDARRVSRRLLDAVAGAAAPLGISKREIDDLILQESWYGLTRWSPKNPQREPHSYERIPLPPPRSVLTGRKDRAGSPMWCAFVVRSGEALLLKDPFRKRLRKDTAYGSLTGLARAAGYEGQAKNFWKCLGAYEEGARL